MPIRGFESAGIVACFDEASGGGAWNDFDAPRNAPAKTPLSHLDKITWHSSFDQFELAAGPTDVTINHTSLAADSVTTGIGSLSYIVYGDVRVTDILLLTHSLGYKPRVKVTVAGKVVVSGQIIQNLNDGRARTVSVYTTTTGVYLRETAYSAVSALPAFSQTYRVFVFRQATPNPAAPLFSKAGSLMTMAREVIRSDREYLRRTGVGDTHEFAIDSGPTIDVDNGHVRVANGGTLTTETGYGGSMAAPAYATVGL